jgi:hypothetical protein
MKMPVLWGVAPCSLVEIDPPIDGGSKRPGNVRQFLWECTAQRPRRQDIFILVAVRTWNISNMNCVLEIHKDAGKHFGAFSL